MTGASQNSILDLFHGQVEKTPSQVAVVINDQSLTYRELDELSDQVAHVLITKGVKAETFIAICLERSLEMIVGILGILKAGGAYVPIDPDYPDERIRFILEDIRSRILLTNFTCSRKLDAIVDSGIEVISIDQLSPSGILSPVRTEINGNHAAYIIYTSGSTGTPKGVVNEHAGLLNRLAWAQEYFGLNSDDAVLQKTTYCFDVSVWELLWPILVGSKLVFAEPGGHKDSVYLKNTIEEKGITTIHFVPSMLEIFLLSVRQGDCPGLKRVLCSGEALAAHQIGLFREKLPHVALYNLYGPTEAAIDVTCWKVPETFDEVSIGSAVSNTFLYVLDENLRPLPEGESGELFIGGVQVARGYLNRPELNEKYFIRHTFENAEHRLYRTGDLAKFNKNGEIIYLGRIDNQVKIRGLRIELGEIEHAIIQTRQVRQCCVHVYEDPIVGKQLIGYLVGDEISIDTESLNRALKKSLPEYMIPSRYLFIESLPLNNNGKLDRKALPRPVRKRPDSNLFKPPATPAEKMLATLWSELLGMERIGIYDNFFEFGGNSLLAMKMVAILNERYAYSVSVIKLYQFPTIQKFAQAMDRGDSKKQPTTRRRSRPSHKTDVAIIGMSGRFPGAETVDELWNILLSGKESVTVFQDQELDSSIPVELRNLPEYVKVRGIIDRAEYFDAAVFGITPVMARLMDPQQRIFLEICRDVLEQAGYLVRKQEHTIGVYAGSGNSTYLMNNVQHHPEEIARVGEFQTMLANEKDYLPTRVAYQLDLTGPAVAINTACSTSLVAVAYAVEAIRSRQCDLAIAGGVSITVPINSGQRFEEGAMFSKDGHTRTFDASATGTVFSDGAGVVLLKDLEAARTDGDTIYAIIRGVGVNNDGGGKGSFMAPSPEGQAQAIRSAIDDAGILPDDIDFIEAHGTATPLGDPIEIEGLNLAFGETAKKQYCRIGSVKSNLGHLTHAAGVTGLIKTALSLYHNTLPPSINFDKPNPNIDFAESPFVVNTGLFELPRQKAVLAGVSSFGVGGTNAHVILSSQPTDLPPALQSTETDQPVVINWSAKTKGAAERYAQKLATYLQDNPEESLESVAYTLQKSREHLKFRSALVIRDRTQAIQQLHRGSYLQNELQELSEHLIFLFPGQGTQYPGMGSELYRCEPVYRDAVDTCALILKNEVGEDIRQLIFPEQTLSPGQAAEALKNTRYTQPALFITSYALARLWMSWGVEPTAFIGHSVGEFVGATLAGVFSLDDALKLIAARGKLSASIPAGSMLSVRAPVREIEAILPDTLSIAANNAPRLCVVAGPDDQIIQFAIVLEQKGIACKPLHTSHAFHSEMMRPIFGPFKEVVASVRLSIPKIPIISTVSGSWLTDTQATDPDYWAGHVISTVRFSEAIGFAEQELSNSVYIESGPGHVAATLTKQHGTGLSDRVFFSIQLTENSECLSVRQALAQLWLRGIEPRWEALYEYTPATLRTLPTYAYDKTRYWIYPKGHIDPQTASDKHILHNAMRKDNLIAKIRSILEDASGIDISGASSGASFIELGLDSLLLTQVAQSLKRAFNVPVTFRMLNEECNNLDLLGSYLDAHLPEEIHREANPVLSNQQALPTPAINNFVSDPLPTASPAQRIHSHSPDAITLLSQQISLISQQIALLQGVGQAVSAPLISDPMQASDKKADKITGQTTSLLTVEETAELQKPFGATAKIERQHAQLTDNQQKFLQAFVSAYNDKTPKSKEYTQRHRAHMADPRVVSGFKPATKEIVYALVVNRSKGSKLWDIDGNEYIDILNGFGSNLLGYQPDFIKEALHAQIEEGYEIGPQHPLAGEVSNMICEFTGFDRAALCNTGSEAVLGAMRIARSITGKPLIVAFTGSYHGIVDEVLVRGTKKLKTFPAASGILSDNVQNMLILPYGDASALAAIEARADDIAAVLVEPVQSRNPEIQPVDFLRKLRTLTEKTGCALIFDEVICGFRMHPGGAQALFGIKADIATYGKVIGGGLSIGVIAGKKEWMDALDGGYWRYGDATVPETGVTYFAGTFVRHPLALATTLASLRYLKQQGPSLQEGLNQRTTHLASELNQIFQGARAPIHVVHFGSMWKVKFREDYPFSELLFALLRYKGIHVLDGFPCYMTTALSDDDLKKIVVAFRESVQELAAAGFIPPASGPDVPSPVQADKLTHRKPDPPVEGARLGRDEQGNPAWFIEDKENPGKYLQIVLN